MKPYIHTPYGKISSFTIMIAVGILLMTFSVHIVLRSAENRKAEELYIVYKLMTALLISFISAGFFDALFKIRINNALKISGMTFFGGLIGAAISLYIMLKLSKGKTQYTIKEWFDNLTIPLILFHIAGRMGCFLAGCCYGKHTESFLGVVFPDNIENGIFHNGLKCYPTQLFEAAVLIVILMLVINSDKKFEVYLFTYAVSRFFIEILRGDERGYLIPFLSPAQIISLLIVLCSVLYSITIKNHDGGNIKY